MPTITIKPVDAALDFAGAPVPFPSAVVYLQDAAGDIPLGYTGPDDQGLVTLFTGDVEGSLIPPDTELRFTGTTAVILTVSDPLVETYRDAELAREDAWKADHPGAPLWQVVAGPTDPGTGPTDGSGGTTDPDPGPTTPPDDGGTPQEPPVVVPPDDPATPPADDGADPTLPPETPPTGTTDDPADGGMCDGTGGTDTPNPPPPADPGNGTDTGSDPVTPPADPSDDAGGGTTDPGTQPPSVPDEGGSDSTDTPPALPASLHDVVVAAVTLTHDLLAHASRPTLLHDAEVLDTKIGGLVGDLASGGNADAHATGEAMGKALFDAIKAAMVGTGQDHGHGHHHHGGLIPDWSHAAQTAADAHQETVPSGAAAGSNLLTTDAAAALAGTLDHHWGG